MRISRKKAAERTLKLLQSGAGVVAVNVAIAIPSVEQLKRALSTGEKVKVTIVDDWRAKAAIVSRSGVLKVSGEAEVCELELTVRDLSIHQDRRGSDYTFTGVHYSSYSWPLNYNAGWGRSETWKTYEFSTDGPAMTYRVIDTDRRSD